MCSNEGHVSNRANQGQQVQVSNMAPITVMITPIITAALNTSNFRLSKKDKPSTNMGDVENSGATILTGDMLKAA